MADIEWSDRYGGPGNWPDPETVCKGPCEGMGVYPLMDADAGLADAAEFVTCEECGGTGKRPDHSDGQES